MASRKPRASVASDPHEGRDESPSVCTHLVGVAARISDVLVEEIERVVGSEDILTERLADAPKPADDPLVVFPRRRWTDEGRDVLPVGVGWIEADPHGLSCNLLCVIERELMTEPVRDETLVGDAPMCFCSICHDSTECHSLIGPVSEGTFERTGGSEDGVLG